MVPLSKEATQVVILDPQSMPDSLETTDPRPGPAFFRVSVGLLNEAETHRDVFIVTMHVAVSTESHPLHPVRADPLSGIAVNVTAVPGS